LFFSFSVLFLARELLNTQQNELNKKNEIKVSWYAFLFVVLVCFYPTLFIRMVQIEKDVFLFSLFSLGFVCLFHLVIGKGNLYKSICLLVVVSILLFYRPQFSLVLFITYFYLLFFQTKKIKIFFVQLVLMIAFIPVPLILLKNNFPEVFTLLVAIKSYSVLAGATDVIAVDYDSIIGIYKTIGVSFFYYFFAPISTYALKANFLWKVMMLEPVFFFIIPFFVCVVLRRKVENGSALLVMGMVLSVILALLSVYYESHVGSYMRKRLPLYIMWVFLAFYFTKSKMDKGVCK
jgi:hypothetical protein